jgi:hypothetical protein
MNAGCAENAFLYLTRGLLPRRIAVSEPSFNAKQKDHAQLDFLRTLLSPLTPSRPRPCTSQTRLSAKIRGSWY